MLSLFLAKNTLNFAALPESRQRILVGFCFSTLRIRREGFSLVTCHTRLHTYTHRYIFIFICTAFIIYDPLELKISRIHCPEDRSSWPPLLPLSLFTKA